MQVFPAGKVVHLDQDYLPGVGSSAGTEVGGRRWHRPGSAESLCRLNIASTMSMLSTVAAAMKKGKIELSALTEQRIDYILTTGANWAGPIGDFH